MKPARRPASRRILWDKVVPIILIFLGLILLALVASLIYILVRG
jgi:hypothetical protein